MRCQMAGAVVASRNVFTLVRHQLEGLARGRRTFLTPITSIT